MKINEEQTEQNERDAEAQAVKDDREAERKQWIHSLSGVEGLQLGNRWNEEHAPDKPKLLCVRRDIGQARGWSGIPLGHIALLVGDAGVGKSTLALQLACAVASGGGQWCDHDIEAHGKTLYLGGEDDEAAVGRKIRAYIETEGITGDQLEALQRNFLYPPGRPHGGAALIDTQRMNLAAEYEGEEHEGREVNSVTSTYTKPGDVMGALDDAAGDLDDLKLIIIDPLNAFAAGDIEKDPDIMRALMRYAGDVAAQSGATVLFTHHTRKPPSSGSKKYAPTGHDIRGTSAFKAGVRWAGAVYKGRHVDFKDGDNALELTDSYNSGGVVTFRTVKANQGLDWTPPYTMTFADGGILVKELKRNGPKSEAEKHGAEVANSIKKKKMEKMGLGQ